MMEAHWTWIWELRLFKSRKNAHPAELSRHLCGVTQKMARICAMPVESGTKSTGSVVSVAGIFLRRRKKPYPAVLAAGIPTKLLLVAKETHLAAVSNKMFARFGFSPFTAAVLSVLQSINMVAVEHVDGFNVVTKNTVRFQ